MLKERLLDGRLKLRHLIIVTTIADEGSVVAAARALYVTQPVVTRALHEVEEILSVPLFERRPHGVVPTAYGDSFVMHARAVLAQLRQADSRIRELADGEAGRVVVGVHLAGSNVVLPQAIAALKAERPGLTIVVREATPDVLQRGVLAGEVDLVIGRLMAHAPEGLDQRRLYLEPIRIVARAEHPAHRIDHPSLADLAGLPWILPIEQTALRTELEEAFLAAGVGVPEDRIECTSMLTLQHLLVTSDVLAALPMLVARNDDRLRLVPVELQSIRRSVGVTTAHGRPVSPGVRALVDHLRRAAGELDPGALQQD